MTEQLTMPAIIRALGRGKKGSRNLSRKEADYAMSCILAGTIKDTQLGALLMLLRVKEETSEELAGMVDACHRFYDAPQKTTLVDVNWPAYAGKKKQPSWYVLAALLLAQNGVRILMHGGGQHTANRQYAEEVCRAFNVPIASSGSNAENLFTTNNLVYLPLVNYSPTLSALIDLKHDLGLRSPVNTLVRHLEPFASKVTLQAMFHPAYMPLHHGTSELLSQANNVVIKGDSGEFEVRPDSETAIHCSGEAQSTLEKSLVLRSTRPETASLEQLQAVWHGQELNPYGIHAIIGTAALIFAKLNQIEFSESKHQVQAMWAAHLSPKQ